MTSETPEGMRVRQQSMRQSQNVYKKDYEENKWRYSTTAEGVINAKV